MKLLLALSLLAAIVLAQDVPAVPEAPAEQGEEDRFGVSFLVPKPLLGAQIRGAMTCSADSIQLNRFLFANVRVFF
jgi:hypothetical protein